MPLSLLDRIARVFASPPVTASGSRRYINVRISRAWLAERAPRDSDAAALLKIFEGDGREADWGGPDYPSGAPSPEIAGALARVIMAAVSAAPEHSPPAPSAP